MPGWEACFTCYLIWHLKLTTTSIFLIVVLWGWNVFIFVNRTEVDYRKRSGSASIWHTVGTQINEMSVGRLSLTSVVGYFYCGLLSFTQMAVTQTHMWHVPPCRPNGVQSVLGSSWTRSESVLGRPGGESTSILLPFYGHPTSGPDISSVVSHRLSWCRGGWGNIHCQCWTIMSNNLGYY